MRRRAHVLLHPNPEIAEFLRAHPGEWYLVATGKREERRVLTQTAYRIRNAKLADFAVGPGEQFQARATADRRRPDPLADVEVYARFLPSSGAAMPGPTDHRVLLSPAS